MNYLSSFSLVWIGMLLIVACQGEKDFSLPYEKFVLEKQITLGWFTSIIYISVVWKCFYFMLR